MKSQGEASYVNHSLHSSLARIIKFHREFDRLVSLAPRKRSRLRARRGILCFVLSTLVINAATLLLLDELQPGIRDPEYGRRVRRLQARIAENPGRPTVLFVGSSRTAVGICPAAWEAVRPRDSKFPDPMFFNMSLLGSGPIMELMVLRRLFADGLRPDLVLIEYWPPFLHNEGTWAEPKRVGPERLYPVDREVVQDYFPEFAEIEREMWRYQSHPVFANRERLLVQLLPDWMRGDRRVDGGWKTLDPWGWLPGPDLAPGPSERRSEALAACCDIYKPLFASYRISPDADRALRESVKVVRDYGAAVGFLYLPESSEFRGLYCSTVRDAANEHLAELGRDLGVPAINTRTWMADELLVDGFHLSRTGAAEFTRKLGPAIVSIFPESGAHR